MNIRQAIRLAEKNLGVPVDPEKRATYFAARREQWHSWMKDVTYHAWRFAEGTCQSCGQVTTVMETPKSPIALCTDCLSTGCPWWPTGWVMADGPTYILHSQTCTSHSSFPTSPPTTPSGKPSTFWETPTLTPSHRTSTSSSAPHTSAPSKSLRPMRLSR